MKKLVLLVVFAFAIGYVANKIVDKLGIDQGIEAIVFLQILMLGAILTEKKCKTL